MRYYGKKSLASILAIILDIVILFGIVLTGITYYIVFSKGDINEKHAMFLIALLTIGIIATFIVVIQLRKIVKTLVFKDPFTLDNVKSLKYIANSCFTIAGCYIINFLINLDKQSFIIIDIDKKGIHTDGEVFIFLLAGCFIGILSKVFKQAVKYKEDNDLTI